LERILNENYSMYQDAKHSSNSFDLIASYGVNTYRGIFRNYNEDRVSIIVNAKNPKTNINNEDIKWPNISYFGIFDGHAGNKCSEYLKNNLHHFIFNCNNFPNFPLKAIEQGFKTCENNYIKSIHNKTRNQYYDYSGSCAIITLIIDDMCYVANLGDSRALYSYDTGKKFWQLSRDHKPNDPKEKKRIYKAGGSIFKASLSQYGIPFSVKESDLGVKIPFRILPGRLAVARAFGDVEAKIPNLGGNPKVLIAKPCITMFRIDEKSDFILIGCDGIFDRMENNEILKMIWGFKKKGNNINNIHTYSGNITDAVIKQSMKKMSADNVTAIFIAFKNFEETIKKKDFEYKDNPECKYIEEEIDLSEEL